MSDKLILAVPKGRILEELLPLLNKANIIPEDAFFDKKSRLLQFKTNRENLDIVRVRSFDVATFVAFGATAMGIAGKDVLDEFDNEEVYSPLDLGIGKCRISVAAEKGLNDREDLSSLSHVKVATKYPKITKKYFAEKGIQAECIKLSGAMELAPKLGLCKRIVDLVSTGKTLESNGLEEIETIYEISSCFIVNRTAFKTRSDEINEIMESLKGALNG